MSNQQEICLAIPYQTPKKGGAANFTTLLSMCTSTLTSSQAPAKNIRDNRISLPSFQEKQKDRTTIQQKGKVHSLQKKTHLLSELALLT